MFEEDNEEESDEVEMFDEDEEEEVGVYQFSSFISMSMLIYLSVYLSGGKQEPSRQCQVQDWQQNATKG